MQGRAANPVAATADYRRQARKIRASFADQPLLRHHALNDLAKKHDAQQASPLRARAIRTSVRRIAPPASVFIPGLSRRMPTVSDLAITVERKFADHAASRLRAGAFTFTDRMHLLTVAETLGVPRFRANLILALEQHRIDPHHAGPRSSGKSSNGWVPHVLAIMAVEVAVVGLFVWVCTL